MFTQGAGGRFTGSTGNGGTPTPPWLAQVYQRLGIQPGNMAYNAHAKHGTGYGSANGDPRVSLLQQALNALGFTDSQGKPLRVDGQLGPKTTSAVKKAQRKLGIKPANGVVTPDLLSRIVGMAPQPKQSSGGGTAKRTVRSVMRHSSPAARKSAPAQVAGPAVTPGPAKSTAGGRIRVAY